MPHHQKRSFLEGSIGAALARLAFPIMLGNLLQTGYQLTDAFWVGRLGAAAVDGHTFDAILAQIDNTMLGFDPSHEVQRFLTPTRVEVFAAASVCSMICGYVRQKKLSPARRHGLKILSADQPFDAFSALFRRH